MVQALKQDGFGGFDKAVVVAPDLGSVKTARHFAEKLGVDMAIIDKHRTSSTQVEVMNLIGDVKGKDVLLADDMCSTGHTITSAAKACQEKGANRIFAAVTHGLFVGPCVELIDKSPIDVFYVADTVALNQDAKQLKALCSVSVAGLFGQALSYMLSNKSIASLF
jgi:ribose-phosphate pyrophosphokinase